ncbi:DUF3293 domain-containing protein [Streptomyces sp. AF1A]|uniref:DUF3293 domain-containing protein n=1 Tax=Streptomyces sp. AF1A TaxID=3394350 RepID=UPI0039BD8628
MTTGPPSPRDWPHRSSPRFEGIDRVTPAPRGVTVGSVPAPLGEGIHVVTAHNPGGRLASRVENDGAHQDLLGRPRRRGLRWWPAVGGDMEGRHTEESAAIVGLSDHEACALGRHFGQDAVFARSAATWRLLSCFEAEEARCGWQATKRSQRD